MEIHHAPGRPLPALDIKQVSGWLARELGGPVGELQTRLITGGRSNLTYLLQDCEGRSWVLRRPPHRDVLPTAHDVAREHRVISSLRQTDIPLPEVVALCTDRTVTGAPFYVMEYVDGLVLRTATDVVDQLRPEARRRVGAALAECAARIHLVDPDAVGLGELGKRQGYIHRQLERWMKQYRQTATHAFPQLESAHQLLSQRVPPQRAAGIVHGDYRLDNVIVNKDGEVLAVLDWELCTLGDQLADVGQMVLRTIGETRQTFGQDPRPLLAAPDYPPVSEILAAYEQTRGLALDHLDFYVAFAAWKSACILQGVYFRQLSGAMGKGSHDEVQLLDLIRSRSEFSLALLRGGQEINS